ncbi:MAG TPA: GxxExxY protein [Terriglobia bacterium]|nr:GxxExxY protein [Terriglobia bacterium]
MSNILALCDTVRQTSLAIHQYFRSGHLEKVYENTLAHRLRQRAIVFVFSQAEKDCYFNCGE